MFTDSDLRKLATKGIDPSLAEAQIQSFSKGFPPANIVAAAGIGNGILQMDEPRAEELALRYSEASAERQVLKFVPASGAATRMFKVLFEFRDRIPDVYDIEDEADRGFQSAYYLMNHLSDIPFSPLIEKLAHAHGESIATLTRAGKFKALTNLILDDLGYSSLPKGLLAFHRYSEGLHLACEEHLHEGVAYGLGKDGSVRLHFTVSPEHTQGFTEALSKAMPVIETDYQCRFDINYSIQKPSTDTIAADEHNNPFRDDNGDILFRPGGHGALIENLNDLHGDIIFIKNIDNVVPYRLQAETVLWKKVIGAVLLDLEQQTHSYLRMIENGEPNDEIRLAVHDFLWNLAGLRIPLDDFKKMGKEEIADLLNRPIRVCGMVRNEGEPGGGPFWVRSQDGAESLQIVESAQIDLKQAEYRRIFDASSHFNPVDLVCSVRDYKGRPFNLKSFIDPDTAFISSKSSGGRMLKALELPGLWNGAMAKWLTAFVEVPLVTFNPVKTVNDLLRDQHKA